MRKNQILKPKPTIIQYSCTLSNHHPGLQQLRFCHLHQQPCSKTRIGPQKIEPRLCQSHPTAPKAVKHIHQTDINYQAKVLNILKSEP